MWVCWGCVGGAFPLLESTSVANQAAIHTRFGPGTPTFSEREAQLLFCIPWFNIKQPTNHCNTSSWNRIWEIGCYALSPLSHKLVPAHGGLHGLCICVRERESTLNHPPKLPPFSHIVQHCTLGVTPQKRMGLLAR